MYKGLGNGTAEDYCGEARRHACWTRRLLKRRLQRRTWTAIWMRESHVTCVSNLSYREIEKRYGNESKFGLFIPIALVARVYRL
jgi:hypothetical protein